MRYDFLLIWSSHAGTARILLDGSKEMVGDVWVPLTKDGHHSSNHDGYHTGTDATCGFVRLRIVPLAVPANAALAVLRGQTQSGKASVGEGSSLSTPSSAVHPFYYERR